MYITRRDAKSLIRQYLCAAGELDDTDQSPEVRRAAADIMAWIEAVIVRGLADDITYASMPAGTQSERVRQLAERLLAVDTARRVLARQGQRRRASDLANMARALIGDAHPVDLRSLVTIWTLQIGQIVDHIQNREAS